MQLTEHAVSAGPLLKAIAAATQPDQLSNLALAQASGRNAKNLPRDLDRIVEAGWITREPGSPPALTDAAHEILAALARAEGDGEGATQEIPLHLIDENPENPRQAACDEDDDELTASIGVKGVLQPIMVRPSAEAGRFVVIMGSRRRRCALAAGKFTIPAVVRDVDNAEAFEIATIENLQRADMNPLDEARAFRRIVDARLAADPALKLKEAKQVIADVTGKTPRFVELRLQLLTLPAIKQIEVSQGKVTPKDAINYARHFLPPELPAARVLLLAEIACACAGKGALKVNKWTNVDGANRDDANLAALKKLDLVCTTKNYSTGEDQICVQQRGIDTLAEADRALFDDAPRALKAMQAKTISEAAWNSHVASDKTFVTAWLNPPFAAHPDEIRAQERRKEADEERRIADERRKKETDRRNADFGRSGQAALARVLQLEDDAPGMSDADFADAFRNTMSANGWTLPLQIVWIPPAGVTYYDRDDAVLKDAAGEDMTAAYGALEAMRRMYAIAVNRVAGFASTAGPPLTETQWAKDAAEGLFDDKDDDDSDDGEGGAGNDPEPTTSAEAADDEAEPFADTPADGDEDQGGGFADEFDDDEAIDDDAVDASPAFLTRLAGVPATVRP